MSSDAVQSETAVPVLVRLSEGSPVGFRYADIETADGSDMLVTSVDGATVYPHEVDTWNPAGESLLWVRLPDARQGAAFRLWYGSSVGAGDNVPSATWADYTGVWHLGTLTPDTSVANAKGTYANSTAATGIDGHLSSYGVPNETGVLGKCFRVNDSTAFKGGNYMKGGVWVNDAGTDSPIDGGTQFTISGWFKHGNFAYYYDHVFHKRQKTNNGSGSPKDAFAIESNSGSGTTPNLGPRGSGNTSSSVALPSNLVDVWGYLTFVYDGAKCFVYENGVLVTSSGIKIDACKDNDGPLVFGDNTDVTAGSGDAAWNGWIDEVRFSKGAKSADFIAAEYAAMATADFLSADEVQDNAFAADVLTVKSDHGTFGTVEPAYGKHEQIGSSLTFTAPSETLTSDGIAYYRFVGWERTVERSDRSKTVTSGAGTSVELAHEAGTRETFCWKIEKAPVLEVRRVQQRYPWNGLVDIDYVVSGLTGTEADYRLEVTAHAGGKDIPCRHFATDSAGDLPVADGLHHVVWDASKDAPDLKADDVTVTLDLQYAPVTETMADYIIIDLSAGPTAMAFPVRFVKGDIPASAYNTPTYKTTKLVMKKVKAGTYQVQGSNWARLTHDYFLGIFEVTQRQYELVTGLKPSGCTLPNDKVAEDEIGMRPNEQVVWNNLMINLPTFASILNDRTRYRTHALANFSLPTETQWEVACHAGTTTTYFWGNAAADAPAYAWYGDGQTGISRDHQTEIVGSRLPNPWGFYDMLGNVTEFCADYNYAYPQGTEEEPAVDPHGPESGTSVIARGGNFQAALTSCTGRSDVAPNTGITYSGHMYGFRIAKTCP